MSVALDFPQPGRSYQAEIYRDETDADYRTNPLAHVIEKRTVLDGPAAAGNGAGRRRRGQVQSSGVAEPRPRGVQL